MTRPSRSRAVREDGDQVARPSLVDTAEEALHTWLLSGHHRLGDRLPPEQDLAAMLGVSRGTLRTALQRLEAAGEIVRRQGSGTFVGHIPRNTVLDEGLERLESYSSLARGRGVKLTVAELRIEAVPLDARAAETLDVEVGTIATAITRLLLADGVPAALMEDTIPPEVNLPAERALRRAMQRGDMMLDVLIRQKESIAYATTHITPRLVAPREALGKAFSITRPTAVLELEERFHRMSGAVIYFSRDIFAEGGLNLHVLRWLDAARPAQIGPVGDGHAGAD